MRTPTFKDLKKITQKGGTGGFYGSFMHPSPLFYKYYWWVFWEGSPCDGQEFLENQYRMSTKKAMDLVNKLDNDGQLYWLYNQRLPRLDPKNSPLDPNSNRWRDIEWAKSFDEDTDEEYKGFK